MQKHSSVGVVVPNLGPNQLAYFVIKSANKIVNYDVTLFYENMALPCMDLKVPMMGINEIWPYRGTLIATSLETAIRINKVVGSIRRIFYVNDLEWIRNKTNFLHNLQAFEKTEIIARSHEHAFHIERYANIKVTNIVPIFEIGKIINER